MPETTPKLLIPLLAHRDADAATVHNAAIAALEVFALRVFVDIGTNAPPGSPSAGNAYAVGSSPTGAWSGQAEHTIAWWDESMAIAAWRFVAPVEGMVWYDQTGAERVIFSGGSWGSL